MGYKYNHNEFLKKLIQNNVYEIDIINGIVLSKINKKNTEYKRPIGFLCGKQIRFTFIKNGKTHSAQLARLIWLAAGNDIADDMILCHKDGNTYNNRIDNLFLDSRKIIFPKAWTEKETKILIQNCKKYSYEKLHKMLPTRSIKAIRHKVKNISIKKEYKKRAWTKTEDKKLIELANLQLSIKEIASILHRSLNSIYMRANRICHVKIKKQALKLKPNENNFYRHIKQGKIRGSTKVKCCICGYDKHVHLHHIDGNNTNHHISNIASLCPNHHSEVEDGEHSNVQLYCIWKRISRDGSCTEYMNNIENIKNDNC